MSDNTVDLWDDTEQETNPNPQPSGGQLREFAERTKAKNEELASENATLRTKIRNFELSGVLREAGYDPAAIALVPDSVTDKDGVNSWLEANGSLLNKTATQEVEQQEEPPAPETTLSEQDQANLAATTGAPQGAPPSVSQTDLDRLSQAGSRDEYWQIMHQIQQGQPG